MRSETNDPLLGVSTAAAAAHGSDTASPPFDAKRSISQEYNIARPLANRHTHVLQWQAASVHCHTQHLEPTFPSNRGPNVTIEYLDIVTGMSRRLLFRFYDAI